MLILGVGNPILGDDGAGIAVAKALAKSGIAADVKEAENIGLDILNTIEGYDRVIIVDAIAVVKKEKIGEIIRIENPEHAIMTVHASSQHDVNFASALQTGRKLGMKIPKIVVYGINVRKEKLEEFREGLSPEIEAAVKMAVKMVLREIRASV